MKTLIALTVMSLVVVAVVVGHMGMPKASAAIAGFALCLALASTLTP